VRSTLWTFGVTREVADGGDAAEGKCGFRARRLVEVMVRLACGRRVARGRCAASQMDRELLGGGGRRRAASNGLGWRGRCGIAFGGENAAGSFAPRKLPAVLDKWRCEGTSRLKSRVAVQIKALCGVRTIEYWSAGIVASFWCVW
jgi:hypothetical protein